MNKCIILPPGHGKSYFGKIYDSLRNIDGLHTINQRIELNKFLASYDYNGYVNYESNLLKDKIKKIRAKILLVHSERQAEVYELKVLGNFKLYKKQIEKIIKEREFDPRIYRAKNTLDMWEANKNAEKCKNFQIIEEKIKNILCKVK